MNMLDSLARQVRAHPDRIAVVDAHGTLTYAQLWTRAQAFAWHLREQRVLGGQTIGVAPMAERRYLLCVLAIAMLGATSAPVLGWPEAMWVEMAKRHRMHAWIGDDETPLNAQYPSDSRRIAMSVLLRPLPDDAEMPVLVRGLGEQLWRVTLSSGTTDAPRSVAWTHAAAAMLQRFMLDVHPAGPGERLMLYADPSDAYAFGHLLMYLSGGAAVILPPSMKPERFVQMAGEQRPTRLLTTTVNAFTLVEHLKGGTADKGAFASVLSVLAGDSLVPPALRRDLEQHVCPNVVVAYGCTEVGTLARADSESLLGHPKSAGRVMPWLQAQTVDADGKVLAAGEAGWLRFRSPAMAQGYMGGEDTGSACGFRGGWFYPGDHGAVDARRNLMLADHAGSTIPSAGELAERFKAPVLKTGDAERRP